MILPIKFLRGKQAKSQQLNHLTSPPVAKTLGIMEGTARRKKNITISDKQLESPEEQEEDNIDSVSTLQQHSTATTSITRKPTPTGAGSKVLAQKEHPQQALPSQTTCLSGSEIIEQQENLIRANENLEIEKVKNFDLVEHLEKTTEEMKMLKIALDKK